MYTFCLHVQYDINVKHKQQLHENVTFIYKKYIDLQNIAKSGHTLKVIFTCIVNFLLD